MLVAIFLFGLAVSLLTVARSQVAGDQLLLLARGWLLAVEGHLVPFGMPASGGGAHPGALISVLMGLPLMVWQDHRAPTALVLVGATLAYLLLDRTLRPVLTPPERVLFALLYWLNPWRLFLSGFAWNPNFLFLPAALHLASAFALRRERRFWPSALHLLVLAAMVQMHIGALALVISTALLAGRRYLHLDLRGAALGAAVGGLTLIPWALAVVEDPSLLPAEEGFPGRGLLLVYPLLKGIGHWLRFPGLALGRSMVCLDFSALGGPGLELLGPALRLMRATLLPLTLAVASWANWRLWRSAGRGWRGRFQPDRTDRSWLEGTVRWSFVAGVVTFGLAPLDLHYWQILPLFHLAVLPVVLAAGSALEGASARWVRRAAGLYAGTMLLLGPAFALGAPPYRCGEPRCAAKSFRMPTLRSDHPLLHRLGVHRTCPVVVDDPEGWWIDVLPEPGGDPPTPP